MSILRLKKRQNFVRLSRQGKSWVTPAFVLQALPDPEAGLSIRVGFTASRKVGGAVQRNRAKRRMRFLAGEVLPKIGRAGVDYVLIARGKILSQEFTKLRQDLRWALRKIHMTKQEKS